MSVTLDLLEKELIEPNPHINNLIYETKTGSVAYGVSNEDSDIDIAGFCIPSAEMVFPHLKGEIKGFGSQKQSFNQYQSHGIKEGQKEYDLTIYSIIKFFSLMMDNNPNMIELIFTPKECVTLSTEISCMVREHRKTFLHKGSYFRFRGFAFSQLNKLKKRDREHSRLMKYAYHSVRLLNEAVQILRDRDLVLDKNTEMLKEIREGRWSIDKVENYFEEKEKELEELYDDSNALPHSPEEGKLKSLLLDCLETYYNDVNPEARNGLRKGFIPEMKAKIEV